MSMATAAVSIAQPIDLTKPANYPIRLGNSILKPSQSSNKRFVIVRYNHKPELRSDDIRASVKAGKGGESRLKLGDGRNEYSYDGDSVGAGDGYVLVLKGEGKSKELMLERLSGSHAFNLISAPKEQDADKLREEYPQISAHEEGEDAVSGEDEDGEDPLDADNPFDFRHHLKAALAEHAKRPRAEAPRSTTGTPLAQPRAATTTPMKRPAKGASNGVFTQQKKRKAPTSSTTTSQPSSKRAKATQPPIHEPTVSAPSKQERAKTEAPPKIRMDRKASLRHTSSYNNHINAEKDDESGELILENETPVSEKPPTGRSAMSLALQGQLGNAGGGPISLRSAASSPASHVASPAPLRPDGMGEDEDEEIEEVDGEGDEEPSYEFEFGGSSPEEAAHPAQRQDFAGDEDGDADEEDEDADVEDLELPSPATEHKPSISATTVTGSGMDEDDLDAQLAAAMAEEEPPPVFDDEEEEESEEE